MVMFEFKSNGHYGITSSNASFYCGRDDVEMQKRTLELHRIQSMKDMKRATGSNTTEKPCTMSPNNMQSCEVVCHCMLVCGLAMLNRSRSE